MNERTNTMKNEASGRRATYALFARLFETELDADALRSLAEGEGRMVLDGLAALGVAENSAKRVVAVADSADESVVQRLAIEFNGLFQAHNRVYPHASCWGMDKPKLMGPAWHKVLDFYRHEGLSPHPDRAWLADHIGTELYFASVMAGRVADAPGAQEAQDAQERFTAYIEEHIVPWVPRFLDAVAADERSGFYADAALVALAFIEIDAEMLGIGLLSTSPEGSVEARR